MIRQFFFSLFFFLLGVSGFLFTLTSLDPLGSQQFLAVCILLVTFFMAMVPFWTGVFFFGKEIFIKQSLGPKAFRVALRRGALMALFLSLLAAFQFFRMLGIIEGVLLLFLFVSVELVCLSSRKDKMASQKVQESKS
ncbi:hypothetical protein HC823_01210 [Candidatus Gracilibacteria bacterium]|nr:hypothetical protein [Candidatus Gracilibacteria bacterium]